MSMLVSCYWTGNHTDTTSISFTEWAIANRTWTKLTLRSQDTFDYRTKIMFCFNCKRTFNKTVYRNRNIQPHHH
jgi:hypothetical protein